MFGRLSPRRRRAAPAADGAEPQALPPVAATPEPDAQPTTAGAVVPEADPQPTAVQPAVPEPEATTPPAADEVVLAPPEHPVPAGVELQAAPEAAAPVPSFRTRGRLRRRLRYLRRLRELGFRDLGGLVFDLHRFGREGQALVAGKLEALGAIDAELRLLETALDDRREHVELREPGIAACPRCAALHGSDARFCPACGLHLAGGMPPPGVAAGAAPQDPAAAPLAWSPAPAAAEPPPAP